MLWGYWFRKFTNSHTYATPTRYKRADGAQWPFTWSYIVAKRPPPKFKIKSEKKGPERKDPMGRNFKPIDLKEVERLAATGMTEEQICALIGVSKDTYYRRKLIWPDLVDAVRRGQAEGQKKASGILYEIMTKRGKPTLDQPAGEWIGHYKALEFYLKNRAKWNESSILQINSTPASGTDTKILTDDPIEAAKAYQQLMGKPE
jgi:hypothetical protein